MRKIFFLPLLFMVLLVGTVSAGIAPVADFTSNETSVCLYDVIQFNDTSTNVPEEWFWLFGDSQDSHIQNPTHYYDVAGTFTVTLNATNAFGSDEEEKKAYITVTDCAGNPEFTANVTCQIGVPMPVSFTGYCSYPESKTHWDFGDGNTTDDIQSPEHTYVSYGTYTVTHSCKYAGYDTVFENKTDYIVVGVNGTYCDSPCDSTIYFVATGGDDDYPNYLIIGATLGLICGALIVRRNEQK